MLVRAWSGSTRRPRRARRRSRTSILTRSGEDHAMPPGRRPRLAAPPPRRRGADRGRRRRQPAHRRRRDDGQRGDHGGLARRGRRAAGALVPGHGGRARARRRAVRGARVRAAGCRARSPRAAEDLPFFDRDATAITYDLWHGYRKLDRDGAEPAFPFGFGLGYTTFSLGDLRLARDGARRDGDALRATVAVTNTGAAAGDDVVQLYVEAPGSAVPRAPRELKGFARVSLEPGETRDVTIEVPVDRPRLLRRRGRLGARAAGVRGGRGRATRATPRRCARPSGPG